MQERRIAKVVVTGELMEALFFEGAADTWWRVSKGLPEGAKCVGKGYDMVTDQFVLLFEHPSFAVVPDCHAIPLAHGPQLESIHGVRYDHAASQLVVRDVVPGGVRVAKTDEEFAASSPAEAFVLSSAAVLQMFGRIPAEHRIAAFKCATCKDTQRVDDVSQGGFSSRPCPECGPML